MFKKVISTIIVSTVILSGLITFASSEEYLNAANNLAEKHIINDHKNDSKNYKLDDNVLRQEIAAVARATYEVGKGKDISSLKKDRCDGIFGDVSSTKPNSWACYSIEALVDNDLISANTNFRPEDKITKAETLGMLIKAIGFDYAYNPDSSKSWQEQIVDFAVEKGVTERFTDYNTDATRGWVFMIADVTIKKDEEIKKIIKEKEQGTYTDEAL